MPPTGVLAIDIFNIGDGNLNTLLTAYSGSAGNLTQRSCNDNDVNGLETEYLSHLELSGTKGESFYVRVWGL